MAAPPEEALAGIEVESGASGVPGSICPADERAARDAAAAERRYRPDPENPSDPLVRCLTGPRCKASRVTSIELVEQRWNGNDLYKAVCPEKTFFVKVNESLDPAVFMAESGGLVCIAKAKCGLRVPQPFDIGVLPPPPELAEGTRGSFLVLSWVDHQPLGAMKGTRMSDFGAALASMHSADFVSTHQGRYGFASTTWMGTTAQDNTWCSTWQELLHRRLAHQLERVYRPRVLQTGGEGVVAPTSDPAIRELGQRVLAQLGQLLAPVAEAMRPSLLHGDLWIGNTLWPEVGPVLIDPACCFGHAEFDLALMRLFEGFTEACFEAYHQVLPKASGFEIRQKLYQVYHRLNLLGTFGNLAEGEAAKALMGDVLATLA